MKTKALTHDDLTLAMDELSESVNNVVSSVGHLVKNIDWQGIAPKLIIGGVLLYGLRNRKLLGSIASSVIIGKITKRVSGETTNTEKA